MVCGRAKAVFPSLMLLSTSLARKGYTGNRQAIHCLFSKKNDEESSVGTTDRRISNGILSEKEDRQVYKRRIYQDNLLFSIVPTGLSLITYGTGDEMPACYRVSPMGTQRCG